MNRFLPFAVFGALIATLFWVPSPSTDRLTAFEVGKMLGEQVAQTPDAQEPARSLGETVLASTDSESGPLTILLGAVLYSSPSIETQGASPEDLNRQTRASIVRALRTAAQDLLGADGKKRELILEGANTPAPGGMDWTINAEARKVTLTVLEPTGTELVVSRAYKAPGRSSLLPPLVAIALAILLRKPVIALFAGILVGAFLVKSAAGLEFTSAALQALPDVFSHYFYNEVVDKARYEIILFVIFMLAMVGVITRAGGIHGLMRSIARLASSARRTQIATWFMGLAIFFDDYANTILVGSTMRPLTDRFKVAREKLAWIVDSTAAPVAGVSIFSTWIAFEVSTFSAQLPDAGLSTSDGYGIFLQSLPYRFYCLLTIFFVGLVVCTGRDFGPMLKAERRARSGQVLRPGAVPLVSSSATELKPAPGMRPAAIVAMLPLLTFVIATIGLILNTGGAFSMGSAFFTIEGVTQVLYDGSGSGPLMWGSLIGLLLALGMGVSRGLKLPAALDAAWRSLRAMGVALVILYLAWMVGAVCGDLGTAAWLSLTLSDSLPYVVLPTALFLLAAMVAFSTGSSWSTMTILLPLVVGLAYQLGSLGAPLGVDPTILGQGLVVLSIGAVLEGAIFGDHCSPISDTTVMSSIASASDHVDHVRTQAPYAILIMLSSMLMGYLPCALLLHRGWSWLPWASLGVSMAVLTGLVFLFGRRADPKAT
jgi:Na+/H+ antiporter NhaC